MKFFKSYKEEKVFCTFQFRGPYAFFCNACAPLELQSHPNEPKLALLKATRREERDPGNSNARLRS